MALRADDGPVLNASPWDSKLRHVRTCLLCTDFPNKRKGEVTDINIFVFLVCYSDLRSSSRMADHLVGAGPSGSPARGHAASGSHAQQEFQMDDLFSTRRPKNFKAGLSSGLKSFGKGVATGVAGLVAGPIMGAREDGFKGCAKGMAAGVVGAVILPVTGLGIGAAQGKLCRPRHVL
jgi:hypothetical protein